MRESAGRRSAFDDRGAFGLAGAGGLHGEGGFPAWVAVIYGGPSPEHDVSILTGLQAVQALVGVPGVGGVRSLYWSKSGDWYEVRDGTEAAAFADGVPANSADIRLISGTGGGFVKAGRGLRQKEESLELDAVVICCHGGPGEDGTLQGALDLAGVPYSGPTAMGAALGMDKLAFGALMVYAGLPALARVLLTRTDRTPDSRLRTS